MTHPYYDFPENQRQSRDRDCPQIPSLRGKEKKRRGESERNGEKERWEGEQEGEETGHNLNNQSFF